MKSFAIVIVCYKRIEGIKRLLRALENVDYAGRKDITLIFSIDNSGTDIVNDFASEYNWIYGEKRIREFPERQGLKKHILQCGDFTKEYDIVVVLEDDIFVSNSLYYYAYQAAEFYWNDDNVAGISLYSFQKNWLNWNLRFEPQKTIYDAYFMKIAQSWGQVWTKNKWNKFKDWYVLNQEFTYTKKIPEYLCKWPDSSWLKYHDRYCIETNRYFVYPYLSLSSNCSNPGEHTNSTVNDHQVELQYHKKNFLFPKFEKNAIIYDEYMDRMGLGKFLGIEERDLCIDFWNTKSSYIYRRFLLSTQKMDYKIVKQFSLSLRPIELSVIQNIYGSGIYLYDRNQYEKHKNFDANYSLYEYSFRTHDAKEMLIFSIKLCYNEMKRKMKKIKDIFK